MIDFKVISVVIIMCISVVLVAESCNRKSIAVANEKAHSTRDFRFGLHLKPPVDKQDLK
jgi:hypothetical protein